MTGRVFLNYRRADAEAWADRLFERLVAQFSPENVFMDIDGRIPVGFRWADWLDSQVAACDLMLVLIGRSWVGEFKARSQPGLHDYVRVEIESALKRNIPVVPVFLGDTPMPNGAELPETVRPLLDLQAARLQRASFAKDAEMLAKGIARSIALARGQKKVPTAAAPTPEPVRAGRRHTTSATRALAPRAQLATGKELRLRWGIPAAKAHFHRDGRFYQRPTSFPAALCDRYGYVVFKSDQELRDCAHLRVGGKRINVKGNLWEVPGYVQTNDPVVIPRPLGTDRWSLGDLLARASRDSAVNVASTARALDLTTASAIWRRFRAGQRGIMVRSIYTNDGRSLFDEITARYKTDVNFQRVVDRFLVDFEWLIRDIEKDPAGRNIHDHLLSDSGRVYLFLAHASGRLR
jgi:hypothetical protein